jgi:hypothetical protein
MITEALITKLITTDSVTDLVEDRIYPNIVKTDSDLPAVYVFSDRMSKQGCYDSQGSKTGMVEIGVLAETYEDAYDIMKAIRDELDDFSGIIDTIGIAILRGDETTDQYDVEKKTHIKVIEYEAIAQQR